MHESYFKYNITRPYPFKWFTWVVSIGGAVLVVLFSVLNYAANAYTLTSVYTTDPNSTIAENRWFERAPFSLTNKNVASCQAQDIPINTQLFTTHLGLTYTLANVTHNVEDDVAIQPALTYLNNTLTNCSVNMVSLDAENTNKMGNYPHWAWETSIVSVSLATSWLVSTTYASQAAVTCLIDNGVGTHSIQIALNVQWRPKTFMASNQPTTFIRLNRHNQANLWWANEIL
jgi:hypothetical protein